MSFKTTKTSKLFRSVVAFLLAMIMVTGVLSPGYSALAEGILGEPYVEGGGTGDVPEDPEDPEDPSNLEDPEEPSNQGEPIAEDTYPAVEAVFTIESYNQGTLKVFADFWAVYTEDVTADYSALTAEIVLNGEVVGSRDIVLTSDEASGYFTSTITNLLANDMAELYTNEEILLVIKNGDETIATAPLSIAGGIQTLDAPVQNEGNDAITFYLKPESASTVVGSGNTITQKSGTDLTMNASLGLSGLNAAVVVFPLAEGVEVSYASVDGVSCEILDNYTPAGLAEGRYLVAKVNGGSNTAFIKIWTITYRFPNGTTPQGSTQDVVGYAYAGEVVGGDVVVASGAEAVQCCDAEKANVAYSFVADTNETVSISKSVHSATDNESALTARPYAEVAQKTSTDYTITYKIDVATTGNGLSTGRIFQDSVTISDVVSGFLAGAGEPELVSVNKNSPAGEAVAGASLNVSGTSATLEFDAVLASDGTLSNQTFYVTLKYSKDAYTNMYGEEPVLVSSQPISNTASVTATSSYSDTQTASSSAVTNYIGYYQAAPTYPTLTIQKKISVGGTSYVYNAAEKTRYNGAAVKFTLTPDAGQTGASPETTLEVGTDGTVSFAEILPGTYTLTESAGVSEGFTAAPAVKVIVSELSDEGISTLKIGASGAEESTYVDYTMTPYVVTNTAEKVANIRVKVEKQKLFEMMESGEPNFENYSSSAGVIELYDGDTLVATGTTDAQGWVSFYNLNTDKNYTLKGTVAGTADGKYVWTAMSVTGHNTAEVKEYTFQYKGNGGSFIMKKQFVDPTGSQVSVTGYVANFTLYTTEGVATEYTFTLADLAQSSTNAAGVVQMLIPEGTYIIKETSLTIGGVDASADYAVYNGDGVKVVIVAGEYDAVPTNANATGVMRGEYFENKSLKGQLTIESYNYAGGNLGGNFVVKGGTGEYASGKTVTVPAGGRLTLTLPAGTYTVTPSFSNAYKLVSSDGTTVTVQSGTPSASGTVVSADAHTVAVGSSVQTAVFMHAVLPTITASKTRTDTGAALTGATFTLYKLNAGVYEKTTYTSTGSSLKFDYVDVGTYILVETTVPTGFIAPGYASLFADGASPSQAVLAAYISDGTLKQVTIDTGDYSTSSQTKAAGTITNVPYVSPTIRAISTKDTANYVGATFGLYTQDGTLLATATATASGYVNFIETGKTTAINLTAGTYVIKQLTAAADHIARDNTVEANNITITVTADGKVSVAGEEWKTNYPNSAFTPTTASNTLSITYSNYPKPDVNFVKLGETQSYNDNNDSIYVPLPGAKFVVYYKTGENEDKHYVGTVDGKLTTVASKAAAQEFISGDVNGAFQVDNLWITEAKDNTYYLEEIYTPESVDQASGKTLTYEKNSEWKLVFDFAEVDGKTDYSEYKVSVYKGDDKDAIKLGEGEAAYVLRNNIKPYWIELEKSRLQEVWKSDNKPVSDDPTRTGDTKIWVQVGDDSAQSAVNGVFHIYWWNKNVDMADYTDGGVLDIARAIENKVAKLVDTMTTGGGSLGSANSAISRALSAGTYVVVEYKAPIGAEPATSADAKLFIKDGDSWVQQEVGNRAQLEGGTATYPYFVKKLGENDDDNNYNKITIGNVAVFGGGDAHFVRIYGIKTGYVMDPDDGIVYRGELNGVDFNIYLSFKFDEAKLEDLADKYNITPAEGYFELDADPGNDKETKYQEVTSGTFFNGKSTPEDGEFLSGLVSMAQFAAYCTTYLQNTYGLTPTQASEIAMKYVTYAFKLVEIGPVPPSYTLTADLVASENNKPTYYYDIGYTFGSYDAVKNEYNEGKFDGLPESKSITATIIGTTEPGDYVGDYEIAVLTTGNGINPVEITNLAGKGTIQLFKYDQETKDFLGYDETTFDVQYDLYRVDPAALLGKTPEQIKTYIDGVTDIDQLEYVETITPAKATSAGAVDTQTGAYNLLPGYYWLVESKAGAGYNDYGSFKIGATGTEKAFASGGLIGPIKVSDNSTSSAYVYNKKFAGVTLTNYWNGSLLSTANSVQYQMFFDAKDSGASYAAYAAVGTDGKFTLSGATAKSFANLADGYYKIVELGISGGNTNEYLANSAIDGTGSNYIEFIISGGSLTSLKVNGAAVEAKTPNAANFNGTATNVLGAKFGDVYTSIYVNHSLKGAVVVNKRYIDENGTKQTTTVPASFISATFQLKVKGADGIYVPFEVSGVTDASGYFTWTRADHLSSGFKILLESGEYSITETSYSSSGVTYTRDATPVYFTIGTAGVVYLQNAGTIGTEAAPLTSTNTSATSYFYNEIDLGPLTIHKLKVDGTTHLAGAQFAVYTRTGAEGSYVYTPIAFSYTFTEGTGANAGTYTTKLPVPTGAESATYYIKETTAPSGYSLPGDDEYFEVTVYANTPVTYSGLDNAANKNSIGIVNLPLASITVVKETTYPEIKLGDDVIVQSQTGKIGGLELTLYKLKDGVDATDATEVAKESNWTKVYDKVKTHLTEGADHGTYTFSGLDTGYYRVLETLPESGELDYLNLSTIYGTFANSPIIEIERDTTNNELTIDGSAANTAWASATSTLTIHNDFIGLLVAVVKSDYDDGTKLSGAVYELYKGDPNAGGTKISGDTVLKYTTGTGANLGIMYFDPMYVTSAEELYVKEVTPPTGYVIDSMYGETVKKVTMPAKGETTTIVQFSNKKVPADPTLSVTKTAEDDTIDVSLAESGFTSTYVVNLNESGNEFPYVNYTVKDNGPKFYSSTTISSAALIAADGANKPTYTIDSVTIFKSTAVAKPGASAAPVYASVNGGAWKLLNDDTNGTTFDLNGDDQTVTIKYSNTNTIAVTADSTVGLDFKPGQIEIGVTYDKFEPTKNQSEVAAINNVVDVTATYKVGDTGATGSKTKALTAKANETIVIAVPDLAQMSITKELLTTAAQTPGKGVMQYRITITNNSSSVSIVDPIIIDVMQEDALTLAIGSDGKPLFTAGTSEANLATLVNNSPEDRYYTGAGNLDANAKLTNNAQGDNVVYWTFDDGNGGKYVLAPGESIVIEFVAALAEIVIGDTISNTAYATSGAALRVSQENPTGASFEAYVPASKVTDADEFAMLNSVLAAYGDRGLYIKAKAENGSISRASQVNLQRSISKDGTNWVSTTTPVDFYPTDESVYYRLRIQNDQAVSTAGYKLTEIEVYDILPFLNDLRATGWSEEFIAAWLTNFLATNMQISTTTKDLVQGADYVIALSTGKTKAEVNTTANDFPKTRAASNMQSFKIVFTDKDFELAVTETLTITFKIDLPKWDTHTKAWVDSLRKIAGASFQPEFLYNGLSFKDMESNTVYARLLATPAVITGTVWNDANRDGVIDTTEVKIDGVTVNLYKSVDGGKTWDIDDTTTTADGGKYTFTDIETSYGAGAPIYKVEVVNPDTSDNRFSTSGKTAYSETYNSSTGEYTGFTSSNTQMMNVENDNSAANTGTIYIYQGGTVNAGIYELGDYSVTYDKGDATSIGAGTMPDPNPDTGIQEGTTYTVSSAKPTWPNSGYTFTGWLAVTESGTYLIPNEGANYSGGDTFTMPRGNVKLVAQWSENTKYTVTYLDGIPNDAPTSTKPAEGIPDAEQVPWGRTYGVKALSTVPTRPGYTFTGWKVTANTSTTDEAPAVNTEYLAGSQNATFVMPKGDVTLTAQWRANTAYSVNYAPGTIANLPSGAAAAPTIPSNDTGILAGSIYTVKGTGENIPTWPGSGYVFAGWEVTANGESTTAAPVIGSSVDAGSTFVMPNGDVTLTAKWVKGTAYKVYYEKGAVDSTIVLPGVAATPNNYDTVAGGVLYTVRGAGDTIPTRYGYTFAGWKVIDNKAGATVLPTEGAVITAGSTFTMPAGDVTLEAQWTLKSTHKVTYEPGTKDSDGTALVGTVTGMPNPNPQTGKKTFESITVVGAPTLYGYTFIGWEVTSAPNYADDTTIVGKTYQYGDPMLTTFEMPDGDVVLTAKWQLNKDYKVYYVSGTTDTVTNMPATSTNIAAHSTYTVNGTDVPVRYGYVFAGWKVKEAVNYADGTNLKDNGITYRVPDAANPDTQFTMPAGDVTLEAQWVKSEHTVTYLDGATGLTGTVTGMPTTNPQTYESLVTVTVANPPALYGYTFKGWLVTANTDSAADPELVVGTTTFRNPDDATQLTTFTMPDGDVTLTALWEPITGLNVYYKPGVTDDSVTNMPDDASNLAALSTYTVDTKLPVRDGYNFKGWVVTATGDSRAVADQNPAIGARFLNPEDPDTLTSFTMPDGDVTLTALWEPTFVVIYDANGGMNAPTDSNRYEEDEEVTVASGTPTRHGHTFAGWLVTDDASNELDKGTTFNAGDTFDMPANNVTLTAQWRANAWNVYYKSEGTPSNMPSDQIGVTTGTTVTVGGTPVREGYIFKGWSGLGTTYQPGDTFTMPDNHVTLTAIWEEVPPEVIPDPTYNVFYDGNGATSGVPTDATDYKEGDTVTVSSAVPVRDGYTFTGWSYDGKIYVGGDTFTMPARNVTLTAQWTPVVVDTGISLYLSKVLVDEDGELTGTGLTFKVQVLDKDQNVVAVVSVTANGAASVVTGLKSGERYYVREMEGEHFRLAGYTVGNGELIEKDYIIFTSTLSGTASAGNVYITVTNIAEEEIELIDEEPPLTGWPEIDPDDNDIIEIEPEDPPKGAIPSTGDTSNMALYVIIMVMSMALIGVIIPKKKTSKE